MRQLRVVWFVRTLAISVTHTKWLTLNRSSGGKADLKYLDTKTVDEFWATIKQSRTNRKPPWLKKLFLLTSLAEATIFSDDDEDVVVVTSLLVVFSVIPRKQSKK